MRLSILSAAFATALLAGAAPAYADENDCGLLCRLNGYLASDHMTAAPDDGGAASGNASKLHKGRTARNGTVKHAAAAPAKPAPTAATATKQAAATSPRIAAAKAVPAEPVAGGATRTAKASATPSSPLAVVKRSPPSQRVAAKPPAAPPPTDIAAASPPRPTAHPHPAPKPAPAVKAEPMPGSTASLPVPSAPPVGHRTRHGMAGAVPARTGAPHSATASVLIPGSAPTMAAGFHPFAAPSLR